ncbi:hypothetical protein OUZ56_033601, partial [Daphnia magna]
QSFSYIWKVAQLVTYVLWRLALAGLSAVALPCIPEWLGIQYCVAGCPFEVPDCLYGCFGFAVDGDHVPVLVNVHVDFLLVMLVDQSVYMDKWSGGSSLLIALKVADVRDVLQPATGGGKSAIMILKSIRLKTHPWGTPLLRYLSSDMLFSILTAFSDQEYCCGGFLFIEAADDIGFETNYVIVGSAPTSEACLEFWKRHEVSEIGLYESVSSGGLFGFRIGMTIAVFQSVVSSEFRFRDS